MKITQTNMNNYSHLKSFKGYEAMPLKAICLKTNRIYTEDIVEVASELKEIGEKTGFKVFLQNGIDVITGFKKNIQNLTEDYYYWLQDYCTLLDNKKLLISNGFDYVQESKNALFLADKLKVAPYYPQYDNPRLLQLNMCETEDYIFPNELAGGNFFIGKYRDGGKYALVGENCKDILSPYQMQKLLNVDSIYYCPQIDFHIDMGIRPLANRTILVADDNLTLELLEKISQGEAKNNKALKKYIRNFKNSIKRNEKLNKKATSAETINALEQQNFKIIRVPGRLYSIDAPKGGKPSLVCDFNFMNAIVHQKKDGKLVYITNDSIGNEELGIDFNKLFADYIKESCSEIAEVYFIKGKNNFIAQGVKERYGGIHCMTMEVPAFPKKRARGESNP